MKKEVPNMNEICGRSHKVVLEKAATFRSGGKRNCLTPLGPGLYGAMGHGPQASMLIIFPAEAVLEVYAGSNSALTGCGWTVATGATVWVYD